MLNPGVALSRVRMPAFRMSRTLHCVPCRIRGTPGPMSRVFAVTMS